MGGINITNVVSLFEYHLWATEKLLNHLEDLDSSLFTKEINSVFFSLKETFEHIYLVDKLWINRIEPRLETNDILIFSNIIEAKEKFNLLHNEMLNYLKQANQEQIVEYLNSTGEKFQNSIEEIFTHLVNHGTYHRGNITAMIRSMNNKSTSTDFIFFLRESSKK